jgi:hypothetical protein
METSEKDQEIYREGILQWQRWMENKALDLFMIIYPPKNHLSTNNHYYTLYQWSMLVKIIDRHFTIRLTMKDSK